MGLERGVEDLLLDCLVDVELRDQRVEYFPAALVGTLGGLFALLEQLLETAVIGFEQRDRIILVLRPRQAIRNRRNRRQRRAARDVGGFFECRLRLFGLPAATRRRAGGGLLLRLAAFAFLAVRRRGVRAVLLRLLDLVVRLRVTFDFLATVAPLSRRSLGVGGSR